VLAHLLAAGRPMRIVLLCTDRVIDEVSVAVDAAPLTAATRRRDVVAVGTT